MPARKLKKSERKTKAIAVRLSDIDNQLVMKYLKLTGKKRIAPLIHKAFMDEVIHTLNRDTLKIEPQTQN